MNGNFFAIEWTVSFGLLVSCYHFLSRCCNGDAFKKKRLSEALTNAEVILCYVCLSCLFRRTLLTACDQSCVKLAICCSTCEKLIWYSRPHIRTVKRLRQSYCVYINRLDKMYELLLAFALATFSVEFQRLFEHMKLFYDFSIAQTYNITINNSCTEISQPTKFHAFREQMANRIVQF